MHLGKPLYVFIISSIANPILTSVLKPGAKYLNLQRNETAINCRGNWREVATSFAQVRSY